jgi:hypothetical protein
MPNNNSILSIKNYFQRHGGLQRTNRFDISFSNLPPAADRLVDREEFYPIEAVTIGNRAIEGIADNLSGFGPGRIQPRSQIFANGVLLTFSVTNDNHIIKMFNAWFNYLYSGGRVATNGANPYQKYFVPYYNDAVYPVTMTVRLLDPNGNTNTSFKFYEVMPVEQQSPILLDMTKPNTYMSYQVLMNYKDVVQT